jgi:hypothetical protein
MEHCTRTQEGVRDMFVIIEPDMVEYYLGKNTSVPIVESPKDYFPVNNRFVDSVLSTKLVVPEMDHTNYFCIHKEKIKCSLATFEYASGSRLFCDHQHSDLGINQKCGCSYMKTKGGTDLVIDVDIMFNVDNQFNVEGKSTVTRFGSWRFTNLFVTDTSVWQKLNQDNDLAALHKAMRDVTEHVNNNGGWTIIRWICTGREKDQSSDINTSDIVKTLFPKPHITYLYPSENAVAMTKATKALQLTKN